MGVQLPSEPITRKEQYLAKAAGQAVETPAEPITREEAYLDAIAKGSGGGGGGTKDYSQLSNKPQIAGTELQGNKSLADLGIASAQDVKKEFIGTLDEWNALTTAQQKEYDTYQITDDYSEALVPNYSTAEQKTGQKWIDGSDIYFKTEVIDTTIQLNSTSWTTVTSGSYMDKLLSVMTVSGDGTVSDGRIRWHLESGNVQAAAYEILNLVNPTITLYYTKNE